jgi:hypothetical protein
MSLILHVLHIKKFIYTLNWKDETTIKGLKERLELDKRNFMQEVTDIFKSYTELEMTEILKLKPF